MEAGRTSGEVIIFFVWALGVEIAPSIATGVVGPRAVYRWSWWVSPAMVSAGGAYAARAVEGVFPMVLAWLGIAIAVTSATAFHLRLVPEASQEARRHSVIRDPNR